MQGVQVVAGGGGCGGEVAERRNRDAGGDRQAEQDRAVAALEHAGQYLVDQRDRGAQQQVEARAALVAQALADDDPWRGFVGYLTAICEFQAADRGFNEVVARGLPPSPAAQRLQEERQAAITRLMDRARQAGVLRDDVTVEDLAFVVCGISRTVEITAGLAPQVWRRHLALLLDGFRPEAAHPLPEPPLPPGLLYAAAG